MRKALSILPLYILAGLAQVETSACGESGFMSAKELSIKQNMAWNSIGSVVNLGCQWLLSVLVVRLSAGFDSAGVYSLATSIYGIFAPIAQYRMYTYQVSDVTDENSTGEYYSFRLITNAIALVLCMGYAFATCSSEAWLAIFLYALYKSAMLVIDVFHACDQRNHRMDYMGKSLALQGVGTLLVFISIYAWTHSLELGLFAMAIVTVVIGIVYDYPRTRQFGPITPGISVEKTKYLLVRCLSIVVAGIAASATPSLPRQFLAEALGNSSLGIYASVAAPVAIIQMGASYIYNPLLGYFSERYANDDKRGFAALFVKSLAAIAAIGLFCAIALELVGADLLVFVFGEGIREGAGLLTPLVVLAIFTGVQWFLNDILIAIRDFRGTFISCAVSLLISLAGCIAVYGANGVTIIGLVACIAGIAIMVVCLGRDIAGICKEAD